MGPGIEVDLSGIRRNRGGGVAMFGTWRGYSHFGLVGMGLSGILLFVVSWIVRFLERRQSR